MHEVIVGEMAVQHTPQAPRFLRIPLDTVFDLGLGAAEMMRLTEHRPESAHLEHQPLDRDIAVPHVFDRWQEFSILVSQIHQHRAGFEQRERRAAGPVLIDHRRNFAVRIDCREFRRELVVLTDIDHMGVVVDAQLFEHDEQLATVRRMPVI